MSRNVGARARHLEPDVKGLAHADSPHHDGQEPLVQLREGSLGIEIGEDLGMQPLGDLLDGDELTGAVVELAPDGVHLPRLDGLHAGARRPGEHS
jgi:hypothetical protein